MDTALDLVLRPSHPISDTAWRQGIAKINGEAAPLTTCAVCVSAL